MSNPKSTASIAGHPLHPMLVGFPIAFFAGRSFQTLPSGKPAMRFGPRRRRVRLFSMTLRHRTPNRPFDMAGELRKVITAHFGAARRPLPANHVEGDVHVVARGM
jgi:hypothetical protein